jgi:hypothetical protein
MTARFRDVVVLEIARIANVRFPPSRRAQPTGGGTMQWETPEYTVVEVCAEATGYFYRG